MLTLLVNNKVIMRMPDAHLPFHTPSRSGDRAWKIVDDESGQIIDQYRPETPKASKPITPFKGSWADEMQSRKRLCK